MAEPPPAHDLRAAVPAEAWFLASPRTRAARRRCWPRRPGRRRA